MGCHLLVLLFWAIFLCPVERAGASTMHIVYWNTTSPIFRIDNTDHIIDVNKGNMRFEYDQVNIICPVYGDNVREDLMERYVIYNVSKEEYDSCRITNPSPRVIAVCDKPRRVVYFTITFRSFTPQPGGLEFLPGQDYYFISTSSKEDLYQRVDGRCSSHHMKVIFKICCKKPEAEAPPEESEVEPSQEDVEPKSSTAAAPSTTSPTTLKTTPRTTTVVAVTTSNNSYYEVVVDSDTYSTTKKEDSEPPDPGENEIPDGDGAKTKSSLAPPGASANLYIALLCFVSCIISNSFCLHLSSCGKRQPHNQRVFAFQPETR